MRYFDYKNDITIILYLQTSLTSFIMEQHPVTFVKGHFPHIGIHFFHFSLQNINLTTKFLPVDVENREEQ